MHSQATNSPNLANNTDWELEGGSTVVRGGRKSCHGRFHRPCMSVCGGGRIELQGGEWEGAGDASYTPSHKNPLFTLNPCS